MIWTKYSFCRTGIMLLCFGLSSCGGGGNDNAGDSDAVSITTDDSIASGATDSNGISGGAILTPPSGDANSPEGGTFGSVRSPLSVSDFANQFSAPPNRQAAGIDTIAFTTSAVGVPSKTIRLIQSDGSQDRQLFTAPDDVSDSAAVGGPVWRPDGTELAFYSNFELSFWNADIYAITADGSNLRRLTNVPRPIAYPNFPQGRVELTGHNTRVEGRIIASYIEGSQQAAAWAAPSLTQRTITFSVADFGPGITQTSLVLNDLNACYFDLAANVDVAGEEVRTIAQVLPSPGDVGNDVECPQAALPQWGIDEHLYFIQHTRENVLDNSLQHVYSVMRTGINEITPTARGEALFAFGEGSSPNSFDGDIVKHVSVFRIEPTGISDEILVAGEVNSFSPFSDRIWLTNLSNPQTFNQITAVMPNCGNGITMPRCTVNDVQWLPDGSGFIYSLAVEPANTGTGDQLPLPSGQLRMAIAANGALDDRLLLELPNDFLGNFSIAPDAQRLVIERRGDQIGVTDLHIYNISDGSFGLLVKNASSPAWSP